MKMKAAVLREYNQPITIEEVDLAPPKEKEVLIKTSYTGFCRSDLHFVDGDFKFPLPLVLGHEASGVVMEIGPGVTSIKKGDHVVYNDRNAAEGYHGFVKKYLNLQNYFDYRGIKNVERHVRWTYLAILGVALARAQNGIIDNLTQIAFFE